MNRRRIIQFITLFLILISAILFYSISKFSSIGNGIFVSQNSKNQSVIKQFSDMIISPSEALQGETDGQVNILLLGVGGEGHSGGTLTDTIMILSLKPETHEAALLSIPRDLYVEVEGTNIKGKINSVQEQGDNSPEKNGNELLRKVIEDITGFHIHYFVQLDFTGFTKAVDDMGGIDVYIEKEINDPTYPNFSKGYDPFYISAGWHHLDGATALKVARSRHSTMGDFDRIKRQQEIIKAFRQKIYEKYEKADIIAFSNMFSSFSQNLKTDFEPKELPRLYYVLKDIKNNNFSAQTIDTSNYLKRINIGLGYTLGLTPEEYEETQKIGEEMFSFQISEEEKTAIQKESPTLEIKNATGYPDMANRIAKDLENSGFRVIKSSNVSESEYQISGTQIDYPEETTKKETLKFITKIFSAKTSPSQKWSSEADFVIILGKGF